MDPATSDQAEPYPFTPAEQERLYIFGQAVLAGFYSDQLPDAERTSNEVNKGSSSELQFSDRR